MIEKELFGYTATGEPVARYLMTNARGMTVCVLDRGAVLQSILVPDQSGELVDVVLGYDTVEGYEKAEGYLGALIGRNANRLGGAFLQLDDTRIQLTANEGPNQLHGGVHGFNEKMFSAIGEEDSNTLTLTCTSPDGEEGFPGNLHLTATYTLTDENALFLDYEAESDQDTVVNITNHSYFNLNGEGSGSAEGHTLRILASNFTENDAASLPTGRILPVAGTPMDFTEEKPVGRDISADFEQLHLAHGYDHNFVLDKAPGSLAAVAQMTGDVTGLRLVCATSCPGLQLYTANFLGGEPVGKNGHTYAKRGAVCLETQYFPNYMNCPTFEKPIVRAGETWHETTVYQFGL